MPTLFFAELIFYVVQKYIKPQMVFWLAMLAMLSPVLSQDIHWNVIIVRVLVAFGFICTGFYGKHLVQKQQYSLKILIPVVFSYFLITLFNIKVDLYSVQVGNIIFYILESILGSFLFLLICKKIKMNRSLSFIGQNTIIILCTHQVVMDIFRHYHNFRDVVGLCIIGLLLIEPVCIFVLNKIPILIGKRN